MYHSRFKGTHYTAGKRYGELMKKNGVLLKDSHILNLSEEKREFTQKCLPIYQEQYPEFLEEIRGIADGQDIAFSDLAAFILGIYNFTMENFCTVFACKGKDGVIFGRNSDFLTTIEDVYESCFYKLDNAYSFIGNTTAMTQIEDGVNEHGLAVGLTFCYPTVKKPGLNAGALVRYFLEKCKTVEECLAVFSKFTISSSQTLTIADKTGDIAIIECNCEESAIIRPQKEESFVVAVNEFYSDNMLKYRCDLEDLIHTKERHQIATKALKETPQYTLNFAQNLLSGTYGFMCQYDREKLNMDTVWSTVVLLNKSEHYRCEGNPSRKNYQQDNRLDF